MAFKQNKLNYSVYKSRTSELSDNADGTIPGNRLVQVDITGDLLVGSDAAHGIVGVNLSDTSKAAGDTIDIGVGFQQVIAATPVRAGRPIKCADNGRVTELVLADIVQETIFATGAGGGFANQPANDGIEIVSSDALDVDTVVTIIGTTNGGVVVVSEDVALDAADGTTAVASTKVDWGLILAVKVASALVGTLTVREASADQAITTLAAGVLSKGVEEVPEADGGAFNVVPTIVGSGATTKVLGYRYMPTSGSATPAHEAKALNGSTDVTMVNAARQIVEVYTGDLEAARTAIVRVGAEEDELHRVGRAYDGATAADQRFLAYITP
jgi:hypothetical protein